VSDFIAREVLLGPDLVARSAARVASDRQQRWMLSQPREVRRSYVEQVMDRKAGSVSDRQTAWMLRAPESVRRSYLAEAADAPTPATRWMLTQPDAVRESYVREVVLRAGGQS
jgi:hypothetical protein